MIFAVAQFPKHLAKLKQYGKIISVDGSVDGVDGYDHHKTGEEINMDAMPKRIDMTPDVIITTLADTDAICSAVVLYYGGEDNLPAKLAKTFRSASYYCDYLEGSPKYEDVNDEGLALHFYVKKKELNFYKKNKLNPFTSPMNKRSEFFSQLCNKLITVIDNDLPLPKDDEYYKEVNKMIEVARLSIIHSDELVTVIKADEYLDPLATYQVISTPFQIITRNFNHLKRYSIGIKPAYYEKFSLLPVLDRLNEKEKGWGGRNVAGGGPFSGSILSLEAVISAFHEVYGR